MGKLSKKLVSIITAIVVASSLVFTNVGTITASATTVATNENETQAQASANNYGLTDNSQDGVILHAWCWSFNTIKENMKTIAESGYSSVQTSPAQACLEGKAGTNKTLQNANSDGTENWYYHYQPTYFTLGNYQLGTAEEFKAMCDEADKYGVKVIVDIVANHLSDTASKVDPELLANVHNQGRIRDWSSRFQVTQGDLLGMPDLNSESSVVQNKILNYMKACVAAGADGFRFDAAKSIALPSDTVNSQFWPNLINGIKAVKPDTYIYGETLQDNGKYKAVMFSEYSKYMSVTASQYGWWLRATVGYEKYEDENGKIGQTTNHGKASLSREGTKWILKSPDCVADGESAVSSNKLVGWVESHDTYANAGPTRDMTQNQIKLAWTILTARADIAPLFFNRPTSYPNFTIGQKGSDDFKNADIVAVNKFHNAMAGKSESVSNPTGEIMMIQRGTSGQETGVVLVNVGSTTSISTPTTLKNGTYENKSSDGGTFTVNNGTLSGTVKGSGTVILYNASETPITKDPSVSISKEGGTYTDSVSLTLGAENATSATYSIDNGTSKTYTNGTTISIGADKSVGDTTTIKLTATGSDGKTATKSYTFTKIKKVVYAADAYIKVPSGWNTPNIYVYDDSTSPVKTAGAWPGVAMTKISEGIYGYKLPDGWTKAKVIFNSGSNQVPGASQPGLSITAGQPMIYEDGTWKEYNGGVLALGSITADKASPQVKGTTIKLTANASGGASGYSYEFKTSGPDGEVNLGTNTTGTISWNPSTVGTYTITATVTDADGTKASNTMSYQVTAPDPKYPVIDNISGNKSGSNYTYTVNASGGETVGTGLLFYKFYTVDSSGKKTVGQNYSRSNVFTTTSKDIFVEVQNSLNDTVSRNYTYTDVVTGPTITSFKANLTSPQKVNTSIVLTGQATGTGSVKYKFTQVMGGVETVIKDYQTSNTATWTPSTTGTYTLNVYATDSSNKEVKSSISYVINGDTITNLEINSYTTSVSSPQKVNTGITLSASATGQGTVNYKFAVAKGGTETVLKNYSTTKTVTWTPSVAGTYTIKYYAKDSTSAEVVMTRTFVVNNVSNNLTINSYSASLQSPQKTGASIKLSASAAGEGTLKYRFVAVSGSYKEVIQDYSINSSVNWIPKKSGIYNLYLIVTDSTGKTVQKIIYGYNVLDSLSISSFTTNVQSPQSVGSNITLKVALNNVGKNPESKFLVKRGTLVNVLKDYDSKNAAIWTPSEAGTYELYVYVRDADGNVDAKVMTYTVTSTAKLKMNSVTLDKISPQSAGTAIKITANATGVGNVTYRIVAQSGTQKVVIQDYKSNNSVTWTPTIVGNYNIYVIAKDSTGTTVQEIKQFEVKTGELSLNSVNVSKNSTMIGSKVTISAEATGIGNITYRMVAQSGSNKVVLQDYNANKSVTWTPTKAGEYNIYVIAKDSTGKTVQKVVGNYIVK